MSSYKWEMKMMHRNLDITIELKPSDLEDALKKNKSKHLEDYKKAVSVYFADLQREITTIEALVQAKDLDSEHTINLVKPINNEKLYDKYIGFFSMHIKPSVEISAEDYGCIVDDNWSISAHRINTTYSSKYRG
jgi:hypothetical protein